MNSIPLPPELVYRHTRPITAELLGQARPVRPGIPFTVRAYVTEPSVAHWHREPSWVAHPGLPWLCLVKKAEPYLVNVQIVEAMYMPEDGREPFLELIRAPGLLMRQLVHWPRGVYERLGQGLLTDYVKIS